MENLSETAIPLGVMGTFVIVVALALYYHYRTRRLVMEVIRLTVEKNETVSPLLVESIARGPVRAGLDLRRGCLLIALSLATAVFGLVVVDMVGVRLGHAISGLAAFPGFLGLAFLGFHVLGRNRD